LRYNKKLLEWLDARQEEIIGALGEFVRIESVSDNPEKVREALDFILNYARGLGFKAESCLDGQVGVIEAGEDGEVLGILAHVDVVGPGDPEKWKTEPFDPVISDGRIYGRGTLDDKGAIIACLYAMKAVCELGRPLRKRIRLILGTQEESEWTDMQAYTAAYPLPDYGFTPDGEFPLCNIEKGCLDVMLSFPLEEPEAGAAVRKAGKYLTRIDAGTAPNIVPGLCTAEITEYTDGKPETRIIKVQGKAVHSCQPEKGENAIFKAAKQLNEIGLENNRLLALLNLICEKLEDVYGEGLGLRSEGEYYNGEFVHRNVFSPTILKVERGTVLLNVDVRFPYGEDENRIVGTLKQLAESNRGSLIRVSSLPAVYVSKDRPFLKAFAKAYDEVSGRTNEFTLAYGGSYAKAMPNIVSWGPVFPDEEDTCHEENEYISIKSLMDNAKIFASAISKIVLNNKSYK